MYFIVLVSLSILSIGNCAKYEDTIGDVGLDIYRFLKKYNYSSETHWVHTEDGYVLRMQRISRRYKSLQENKNKPAILLMHGLLCSGMDFVSMGPNKSLALVLADNGFDVWLGNNRGTTWSRQHVTLVPDIDKTFWDYSYETCGYYDLPAKIDYIIAKTGQQKIFYVGHSQGTTQFFAMAALRPEYNEKIALMSALAPIANMNHLSSPVIRLMAQNLDALKLLLNLLGWNELLGHTWILSQVVTFACTEFPDICVTLIFTLCGFDPAQMDKSFLPVLVSNTPAGISLKMLEHYGQGIRSGYFRRFDYGLLNIKHYKSLTPPLFNVSAISAPVALYYSQNDLFASLKDVKKLASDLPNVVKERLIEHKFFSHIDFIFAKDVNEIINLDLVAHLQEFIKNGTTPSPSENRANYKFLNNFIFITFIVVMCSM